MKWSLFIFPLCNRIKSFEILLPVSKLFGEKHICAMISPLLAPSALKTKVTACMYLYIYKYYGGGHDSGDVYICVGNHVGIMENFLNSSAKSSFTWSKYILQPDHVRRVTIHFYNNVPSSCKPNVSGWCNIANLFEMYRGFGSIF